MYIETTQQRNDAQIIKFCESLAKKFEPTPLHKKNTALLQKFAKKIEENSAELAQLMSEEGSRPIKGCQTECARSVETIQKTIDALDHLCASQRIDLTDALQGGAIATSHRFTYSPLFAIVPFNFPLNLSLHKIAPALALGLPFVCKPPKQNPRLFQKLHHILCDSGVDENAFLIWNAKSDQVEDVLSQIPFALLSFTGSSNVGLKLRKHFPDRKMILELGGTASAIVCESANLENAAASLAPSAFGQGGQSCISTQHILIHQKIAASFLKTFQNYMTSISKHGLPGDDETICSPLVDKNAKEKADGLFVKARALGFEIWQTAHEINHQNYIPPSLFVCGSANKISDAQIAFLREEFFAPIATIITFENLSEALNLIKSFDSNLHASIYTNEKTDCDKAFSATTSRSLLHNMPPSWRADAMPYGGSLSQWHDYPQISAGLIGNEGPMQTLVEYTIDRFLIEPV